MRYFLAITLFILFGLPLAAQTPSFEELEFESDSITATYKPAGKNYVFLRSKRGSGGLNKTATADAVLSAEVTEIVLVFTETDQGDIAERDAANQERWENLLKTYPEFFQFSTTYKNLCQCKMGADAEAFKQAQGFYVYINGEVPKIAEPKAEEPPKVAANPPAVKTEKAEEKKPVQEKKPEKVETTPVTGEKIAVADKTEVKIKEVPPPAVKEKQEAAPAKVNDTPVGASKSVEKTPSASEPEAEPVKEAPRKKPVGIAKSRKAKDPKACRMACYENGDDDLNTFFKDNLKLTKKQRRAAKKQVVTVKLQLNVDGSIKKAMVTCPDEKLNVLVTDAVKSMNPWNATVKNGLTVKSEVKITLKYDKPSKSMKAFEVAVTPRLAPKCKCASNAELFGD